MVIQNGDYATAGFWVVVVMIIAFISICLMNLIGNLGMTKKEK
jgi:molybdate transport system permease protein